MKGSGAAAAEVGRDGAEAAHEGRHGGALRSRNGGLRFSVAAASHVEAERLYRLADRLREKVGTPDSQRVGTLTKLGLLANIQGRPREAEMYYKEVVSITSKSKTPDIRNVAFGLLPLAIFYQSQGRLEEAEVLARRAAAQSEKAGETSAGYVSSLTTLASLCEAKKDYMEAERLRKRILELTRKMQTLEKTHFEAARMQELANVYLVQGDPARAEPFIKEAQVLVEKFGTLGITASGAAPLRPGPGARRA